MINSVIYLVLLGFFTFSRFGLPVVFHTKFVWEYLVRVFQRVPLLGLFICYRGPLSESKTVEIPFVAISGGLNHRMIGLHVGENY